MSSINFNENFLNINKVCRICLEEKSTLLPLYSPFEVAVNPSMTIAEVIVKLCNTHNEDLVLSVCPECVELIKAAYTFKTKYEQSTAVLESYVSSSQKTQECLEDDVNNEAIYVDSDESNKLIQEKSKQLSYRKSNKTGIENKKRRNKKDIFNLAEDLQSDSSNIKQNLHPCPVCTIELPALELREHAHTHKALTNYLNIPNSTKISSSTKFIAIKRNTTTIFNQTNILHKCPYCNEKFSVTQFRSHVDLHRKQNEYKCDKCQRVFRKLNHLNTHRVKHLKEYPYKCNQCDKGFVIKNNYDCHMLTHTNTELPHECSFCLKRFSNPEHLNRHQIIHTENVTYSVKYKVCRCHHCLKTFRDRDELKNHVCVPVEHSINTNSYPCKTCNKVFKQSSGLSNHNRNIHKLNGAKTLCSVCGNYVSNIYNHMLRHSGEKPYQCTQCDKRFIAKPQLRQHLLVHSGLKPYVCSICAKAFNNLYNLQVHERIHKGDRCHVCNICNKGFLEKSYLRKHMNVHKNI